MLGQCSEAMMKNKLLKIRKRIGITKRFQIHTSRVGFQQASNIMTRFANVKLIPWPPAFVEINKSLEIIRFINISINHVDFMINFRKLT